MLMKINLIAFFLLFSIDLVKAEVQTIPVHPLPAAPVLDGQSTDWETIPAEHIPLHNTVTHSKITLDKVMLKAGVYEDNVYFHVVWADEMESALHKPFVWNEKKDRYVRGEQREDRFALQFEMSGRYDTNWFSGATFRADMWHWKASRTNPLGKADDKMTIVSLDKLLRGYQGQTPDKKTVYIQRPRDEGDKFYRSERYGKKQEAIMPKYILISSGQGSSWDIDAKGVWHQGYWTLELRRKLDTGHEDDVKFVLGTRVLGGIAVFNQSENDDHAISDVLRFQF